MNVLLSAERIQERIDALAKVIAVDYRDHPLSIVGVLTGSLMFLADLVRRLDLPLRIGFIQASSYRGEATRPGELRLGPEIFSDVRNRHVLLLDDILDTGHTLAGLKNRFRELGPKSIRIGVLLRKLGRQEVALEPDYVGFEIPDAFVVGYGLDFNDELRNLPYIGQMTAEECPAKDANP